VPRLRLTRYTYPIRVSLSGQGAILTTGISTVSISRVFHHYSLWEDYQAGLYGGPRIPDILAVGLAVNILSNAENCRSAMREVLHRWPLACEQNLSHVARNRQAWLGQACCCLEVQATEDQTKASWHELNEDQQRQANQIADECIAQWEHEYRERMRCRNGQLALTF
jgi:hypothetical protein